MPVFLHVYAIQLAHAIPVVKADQVHSVHAMTTLTIAD